MMQRKLRFFLTFLLYHLQNEYGLACRTLQTLSGIHLVNSTENISGVIVEIQQEFPFIRKEMPGFLSHLPVFSVC